MTVIIYLFSFYLSILDQGKSPRGNAGTTGQNANQQQILSEEMNFGNVPGHIQYNQEDKNNTPNFPNGKQTLKFEDFISIIKDSCMDKDQAENYLVYAFSMFDRKKKGFINQEDLKDVFGILGENVSDDEVNSN